jgi:hypothetical protein
MLFHNGINFSYPMQARQEHTFVGTTCSLSWDRTAHSFSPSDSALTSSSCLTSAVKLVSKISCDTMCFALNIHTTTRSYGHLRHR